MKFLKKGIVLITSLILSLVLLLLIFAQNSFCYDVSWCRNKWSLINSVGEYLFLAPTVLLFSLITYRMKNEVFQKWIRFAAWYIPFLIIGYFIYPKGGGGFGVESAIGEAFTAMIYILFILIFIIISTIKIIRARKNTN